MEDKRHMMIIAIVAMVAIVAVVSVILAGTQRAGYATRIEPSLVETDTTTTAVVPTDDSDDGGGGSGPVCGDDICAYEETNSSSQYYCPEDCEPSSGGGGGGAVLGVDCKVLSGTDSDDFGLNQMTGEELCGLFGRTCSYRLRTSSETHWSSHDMSCTGEILWRDYNTYPHYDVLDGGCSETSYGYTTHCAQGEYNDFSYSKSNDDIVCCKLDTYNPKVEFTLNVKPGLNYVSVPVINDEGMNVGDVFPGASQVIGWDGTNYVALTAGDMTYPGRAYWVNVQEEMTWTYYGMPATKVHFEDVLQEVQGTSWHQIGCPYEVFILGEYPVLENAAHAQWYLNDMDGETGYIEAEFCFPGFGLWVQAEEEGYALAKAPAPPTAYISSTTRIA